MCHWINSTGRVLPYWYSFIDIHTLSGRIGSALVWHTRGRVFEPRLLQQVLRFVGSVYTV